MDKKTMMFNVELEKREKVKDILLQVNSSLEEKEYNSINQLVGYVLSGDPSFITSHDNARNLIRNVERDEILEELLIYYFENNKK